MPSKIRAQPLLLASSLAIASLASCAPAADSAPSASSLGETQPAALRVQTYNVNFSISDDKSTVEQVGLAGADIVFLQETTAQWESVLRERWGNAYPHISFRHCCRAGGMAVLSKFPFDELAYIDPPPDGWFPGWLVAVHTPIGDVQVLNVHLRPAMGDEGGMARRAISGAFTTPEVRDRQIRTFAKALDPELPALVVGDFNEGRSGRAMRFLDAEGFQDALQELGGRPATWRWGSLHRQFDHVLYGPEFRVESVRVVEAGHSDHLPVVVELSMPTL